MGIKEELIRRDASLESRIVVDGSARDSQGNMLFTAAWIKDNALDGTLLIVGSDWQNPRFWAIANGTLQAMDLSPKVQPVGAGSAFLDGQDLGARIRIEQTAIWRDAARSLGYFESCDFTSPDNGPSPSPSTWVIAGIVIAVLVVLGALLACSRRSED